uniref:Peptidase S1 domain-containing protein n=1 Tax=Ditylenchus dipsaci TaxID=166011 RepID=A0A915E3L2_9BILA
MLFLFSIFVLQAIIYAKKLKPTEYMVFGSTDLSMSLSRLSEQENANLQAKCGSNSLNQPANRIAGGTSAEPRQFPFAVSFASNKRNFCGGSLISNRHVLTALHCLFNFSKARAGACTDPKFKTAIVVPKSVQVHYGGVCIRVEDRDKCKKVDSNTAYVKKVLFPKEFIDTGCRYGDDFAIVELDRKIQFSTYTQPVCLKNVSRAALGLIPGFKSKFSGFYDMGWGKDVEDISSARLKFIKTAIKHVHENYFFARAITIPGAQRTSICVGDSGGPLVGVENNTNKAVLLGVHSSGDVCTDTLNGDHKNVFVPKVLDKICKWTGVCP